jgi:hypothetical protein
VKKSFPISAQASKVARVKLEQWIDRHPFVVVAFILLEILAAILLANWFGMLPR